MSNYNHRIRPYYVCYLENYLKNAQINNPQFSLRAFAKKLEMSAGSLSEILNGKRALSSENAKKIIDKLKVEGEEEVLFLKSVEYSQVKISSLLKKQKDQKIHYLEDNYINYKIMMEWEHYAILAFFDHPDFSSDLDVIATKFNLNPERVNEVLSNLSKAGLIQRKGNMYFKGNFDDVAFDVVNKTDSLYKIRRNVIKLAYDKFSTINQENSHYASRTLSVSPQNLNRAMTLMDEFVDTLNVLLGDGDIHDVYKFSMQLYPLSTDKK